jgi:hypothetical protein
MSRLRVLRALLLVGLLCAVSAGCRAPKDDPGTTTIVERTRVSRVTGTEMDTPPEATADDVAGQPCRHVWRAAERQTHMYWDTSGEIPMTALCTPIRCDKCGATRHECVRRRRR